jgi:hypothetical protein
MASLINATTTGLGGIITTGDNSGSLALQTGGTTALTIDTSQNVGIGTSSPAYKLDVTGTMRSIASGIWNSSFTSTTAGLIYCDNTNGGGAILNIRRGRDVGTGGVDGVALDALNTAGNTVVPMIFRGTPVYITDGTGTTTFSGGNLGLGIAPSAWTTYKAIDILGYASFSSYNGNEADMSANAYYNAGWKYKNTAAATLYQQDTGVHRWQYAPSGTINTAITWTPAMTLDASGNLLVGTTSQIAVGGINGISTFNQTAASKWVGVFNANNGNSYGIGIGYANSPNVVGNEFIYCQDSTTLRMSVRSNGGIANYSANNVNLSDATMKKDITPAKSYLSILNQIPVVTFLLNDQTDTDLNLGVTAQSVQAVAPELVGTMDVGTKETPNVKLAIYETDLKYAMLKAIQELSAQVTELKAEVATLKGTQA